MQVFVRKPSIDLVSGVIVTKDTNIEYKNKNVEQSIKDLVFHSITKIQGDNFESTYDTTIRLKDGDVLVFEEEGRGYIKPVAEFVTITEAIADFENIKGVGE
jgi:hypothetical protein